MELFFDELLEMDSEFTLKLERVKDKISHCIEKRMTNNDVFSSVQRIFRLNYCFSKDHQLNYLGNSIIYIRDRSFYMNSKEHRRVIFNNRNMVNNIVKSCKNYFIFPIITQCEMGAHFVFMLYIKVDGKFYLFDSSGYLETRECLYDDLYYIFPEFEIIRECYILQELSDQYYGSFSYEEILGFCLSWGSLLIYCYIKFNREISYLELVNKILDHCDHSGPKLKKLIKNFSQYILTV